MIVDYSKMGMSLNHFKNASNFKTHFIPDEVPSESWGPAQNVVKSQTIIETPQEPAPAAPSQYDIWAGVADQAVPGLSDYGQRWHIGYFISDPITMSQSLLNHHASLATQAAKNDYVNTISAWMAPLDANFILGKLGHLPLNDLAARVGFFPQLNANYNARLLQEDLNQWADVLLSDNIQNIINSWDEGQRQSWIDTHANWFNEFSNKEDFLKLSPKKQLELTALLFPEQINEMLEAGIISQDEKGNINYASAGDGAGITGKQALVAGGVLVGTIFAVNLIAKMK